MEPFPRVRRARTHEILVEQIRERVERGDLPPGSALPSERQLMAEFGVSRSTVRNALHLAEASGLIDASNLAGRNTRVVKAGAPAAAISGGEGGGTVTDLLCGLLLLDGAAAAMAAAREQTDSSGLDLLMDALANSQTVDALLAAEDDLRCAISDVAFNGVTADPAISLRSAPSIQKLRRDSVRRLATARQRSCRAHTELLEAIRRRDPALARLRSDVVLLNVCQDGMQIGEIARLQAVVHADTVAAEAAHRPPISD